MRGRAVRTADEAKQVVDESSVGDVLTLKVSLSVAPDQMTLAPLRLG